MGKKALVVVATDGESSDGDVSRALEAFRHLPVWIVIRLCTDQENVVAYWNDIDDEIEREWGGRLGLSACCLVRARRLSDTFSSLPSFSCRHSFVPQR